MCGGDKRSFWQSLACASLKAFACDQCAPVVSIQRTDGNAAGRIPGYGRALLSVHGNRRGRTLQRANGYPNIYELGGGGTECRRRVFAANGRGCCDAGGIVRFVSGLCADSGPRKTRRTGEMVAEMVDQLALSIVSPDKSMPLRLKRASKARHCYFRHGWQTDARWEFQQYVPRHGVPKLPRDIRYRKADAVLAAANLTLSLAGCELAEVSLRSG